MWKRWKDKLQIRRKYFQFVNIEFTEISQNQIVKNQTIPLENGQKTWATISLKEETQMADEHIVSHYWVQIKSTMKITRCFSK